MSGRARLVHNNRESVGEVSVLKDVSGDGILKKTGGDKLIGLTG